MDQFGVRRPVTALDRRLRGPRRRRDGRDSNQPGPTSELGALVLGRHFIGLRGFLRSPAQGRASRGLAATLQLAEQFAGFRLGGSRVPARLV